MMPFFIPELLPLPSLKTYALISSTIWLASLCYGNSVINDYEEGTSLFYVLYNEHFCLWANVNMAYCLLFFIGTVIQKLILSNLRLVEEQHLRSSFWNLVFYKIIFIFGVVNAQSLTEILCWLAWFSMLAFWSLLQQLCKDRHEFLTASPMTPRSKHLKVLSLLSLVLVASICLSYIPVHYAATLGFNIFLFMMAECLLLGLKSLHVMVKYSIQLLEVSQAGLWNGKARIAYYADFLLEMFVMMIDLIYHIHMLIWSNVFLSMASLVLYWNIRSILSEMKIRMKKHRRHRRILKRVHTLFPLATDEELEQFGDHCAICWENMSIARKLTCGHLYHHVCLCLWLAQDVSCPTCRRSLSEELGLPAGNVVDLAATEQAAAVVEVNENENNRFRNYFFHLDGRQIANWFPSFSIEVFHGRHGNLEQEDEQELNELVTQVHAMFPDVSRELIAEDIRRTGSPEDTAERILEGLIPRNSNTQQLPDPVENELAVEDEEEKPSITASSLEETSEDVVTVTEEESPAGRQRSNTEEELNFVRQRRIDLLSETRSRRTDEGCKLPTEVT